MAALIRSDSIFMISDLAVAEIASAMSRLVRSTGYPAGIAQSRLDEFDEWRAAKALAVTLTTGDVSDATALVRRFDLMLRAPDALHLVLARRSGASLATLDRHMSKAAQAIDLPLATIP